MARKLSAYLLREIPLWLIGLLTSWMPENLLTCRLRGVLSRPFFRKCGKGFSYGARVRFVNPGKIEIGRNVYIAQDGWINGRGGLVLGDSVTIGPRCGIVTTFHRREKEGFRVGLGAGEHAPIRIGPGTWIGMNSVVTHGVTVGAGCLIGANAVVTRDVPEGVMVAGVPAREIRRQPRRTDDSQEDHDEQIVEE